MIDHGRWSLTKGGCTWRFVCYFTYLTLARPKYHIDWKWLTPKLPWRTVRKFTVKWVSLFTCVPATQFALNGRNSSFKVTAAPHHLFKVTSFYMTAVIMKEFVCPSKAVPVRGRGHSSHSRWAPRLFWANQLSLHAHELMKYDLSQTQCKWLIRIANTFDSCSSFTVVQNGQLPKHSSAVHFT